MRRGLAALAIVGLCAAAAPAELDGYRLDDYRAPTPATVAGFEAAGDTRSAAILQRIYRDEIRHVSVGAKWFESGCESRGMAVVSEWQRLVRTYFRGAIKGPFNDSARGQAGLSRDLYAGLADQEYV